jgi:membrane-associated phospholipid phosphatase
MTVFILLMADHYGLRRTARAIAAFAALTMVATVYLGWHYVVDDIAGVAIALVSTQIGRIMVRRRSAPDADVA